MPHLRISRKHISYWLILALSVVALLDLAGLPISRFTSHAKMSLPSNLFEASKSYQATKANEAFPELVSNIETNDMAREKLTQELAKFFTKQEVIKLDTAAVVRRVRKSGRLSLATQSGTFDLDLIPRDLRAASYRAEEVSADGIVRSIEAGPVRTYKGSLRGVASAHARFTIADEVIEGLILTDAGQYYIEPAKRYSASADDAEFVVYRDSDVMDDSSVQCNVTWDGKIDKAVEDVANVTTASTSKLISLGRVVELATEADYEYVTALGGSAQANNEILSIMNVVEGVYEKELGITFEITYQHTWATADDPYNATDSQNRIREFQTYWNSNFQSIHRDLAHMWTGTMAGGVGGGVCNDRGYGTSSITSTNKARTPVHELGHNLGASHPDQWTPPVDECAGTIMRSIQARDLTFCSFSRNQIASFVIARASCLALSPDSCAALTLSTTDIPFTANGGVGVFNVEAASGCSWTARSNVDWIRIVSGGTGSGNGSVNYSVTANTNGTTRVGTISVGSRILTITQDSPACASVPLPVSWWRAEGNANDSTGPNHGKLLGTATFGNGLIGQAFRFNWVNIFEDYFAAPTIGLPKGNNDMTVEFWFRFENSNSDTNLNANFESYIGGSARSRYEIRVPANFPQVSFLGDDLPFLDSPAPSVQMPGWHHVAVTNQGNNVTIYVEGQAGASGTRPINIPSSTAFYIGQGSKGFIDEVSVYSRALTPAQVQAVFAAGSAGKCGAATSTVQFSSADYSVDESAGRATITITRSGDTLGPASVSYSTIDDPEAVRCDTVNARAYARCDYATSVDTVVFAPGENTRTITVPIIDDAHYEGFFETVQLRLSNPVGATLGSTNLATLVITDNDSTGNNPITTSPFFVRMQYLDFLSREPEEDGLAAWLRVLNGCSDVNSNPACDRLLVSSSFFRSQEFQLKGYFVYLFYKAAFNRRPHYDEIISDMRGVTGQTPEEVYAKKAAFTNALAARQEFRNAYDGLTNAAYVDALLGRYSLASIVTPDPANPDGTAVVTLARNDLINRLNAQTLTRAQVLRAVVQSREVDAAEYNGAFVAMQYYGYLRRAPEEDGYQAWLRVINANPTDFRVMVNGFMNSVEYRLRFGTP